MSGLGRGAALRISRGGSRGTVGLWRGQGPWTAAFRAPPQPSGDPRGRPVCSPGTHPPCKTSKQSLPQTSPGIKSDQPRTPSEALARIRRPGHVQVHGYQSRCITSTVTYTRASAFRYRAANLLPSVCSGWYKRLSRRHLCPGPWPHSPAHPPEIARNKADQVSPWGPTAPCSSSWLGLPPL